MALTESQRDFLRKAVQVGLRDQAQFAAEPILARTGKGFLRPSSVEKAERVRVATQRLKSR